MASQLHEHLHDDRFPVAAHLGFISTFTGGLAAVLAAASKKRRLPHRMAVRDITLLGLATYKISRLITRDRVTEPLRAPFTEAEGSDGSAQEKPTGHGLQRALGELLTCPHCVGPWVALALGAGYVWAPRATRFGSGLFASMVVSDVMHRGYSILETRQERSRAEADYATESVEQIAEAREMAGPIHSP